MKHSKKDQVQINIAVNQRPEGGVLLSLRDDGQGYAGNCQALGKIFQKGTYSQGTGVGLYLVQIFNETDGRLDSILGLSVLTGLILAVKDSLSRSGCPMARARGRFNLAERLFSRLLLVEDEKDLGSTLRERLVQEGFDVTWTTTGRGYPFRIDGTAF